ncbi:telomerase protein component 1 [Gadus morhua]|uniref:telomerase protein component 1 n=1 Tax=Gadus morhua TaxID=8049 RepID=UPI0011B42A64|nr:telomerase protein component 1 [Gadus morhua]
MKGLTLMPSDLAGRDRSSGRSLLSNYLPPCLESKLLAQHQPSAASSALLSLCPSLQPTQLSSTTSARLLSSSTPASTSTSSSPLLSTQSRLLQTASAAARPGPLLRATLDTSGGALLRGFAHLPTPSSCVPTPGREEEEGEEEEEEESAWGGGETFSQCSSTQEPSSVLETSTSDDDDSNYDEVDADDITAESPVLDIEMANQEQDQTLAIMPEEFPELQQEKDVEAELNDKKYLLLNAVFSSLLSKTTTQKRVGELEGVWPTIVTLATDISSVDPQFLLKVAVYTRQELNIRITANFLLALAAFLPATKPHVRRYYCAAVQLPSDWLEVARLYSMCFSHSMPACLKKAMADKFKHFSEYQLAKYNTRKHRGKTNKKSKAKKHIPEQIARWAKMLSMDEKVLTEKLNGDKAHTVVDKKQKEFNMKKMIARLHIKEPAQHVMAVLGKKYPASAKQFIHSGLKGEWDRKKAGLRMKLEQPVTWERLLSQQGNKAATWEQLIDSKALPFMAMLRNLRNMITQGISEQHHQQILDRLTNKNAVVQSRQFPLRFLSAYKVIVELKQAALAERKALPTDKQILFGILKQYPTSKRHRRFSWKTASRGKQRLPLAVPFIYTLYMRKRTLLRAGYKCPYSVELMERYGAALETAVQLSCVHNIPPLPGRTLVLLTTDIDSDDAFKTDFCCPKDPEEEEKEEEEEEEKEEEEGEDSPMEAEEEGKDGSEEEKKNDEEEKEEEKSKDGSSSSSSSSSKDEEEKEEEKNKRLLTSSVREVAVLISLLIGCSAEETKLCTYGWYHCTEVKLKSHLVLENFKTVAKQVKDPERDFDKGEQRNLKSELFSKENKWDNIVVLVADGVDSDLETLCTKYMNEPNSKSCLLVKLFLKEGYMEREKTDKNNKNRLCFDFKSEFRGVSEQILRIVAERGSSRLLQHVEHMDKVHKIPPPEGATKLPRATSAVVPVPASPKLRWRGVRVFISSTFRDMHAERDVLVRAVFPELRRRAAAHRLHLQEVELRWGVTEEESGRAAELCLTEVCRSHLLVGVLGERYGTVAATPPHLPDLPQHRWLASAPSDLSITELEIRQFEALYPDDMNQRAFCYFRDPAVLQSVPVAWRSHFAPESKQAQAKMSQLKGRILKKGVKVTEDYPCEWDGVVGGNPYLRGLEEFGKAVLEDLWTAVLKQYVEAVDDEEQSAVAALSGVTEQGDHQEALQGRFHGRAKLLAEAVEAVRGAQARGGVLLVHGAAGEGKTVFMAALALALRTGDASKPKPASDVLSYSTGASQSARTVENLLRCLVQWLRAREDKEEQSPLPVSYMDLIKEFRLKLTDVQKDQSLALLVDGAELVQDGRGQLNSDWMPQEVPKGMCLVVSVTNGSALLQALTKKKGAILFPLGQLSMTDRKEIVQKGLDMLGKKLSDAAFNNQLQTLMMKNGAASPLYLHLACEDLRNFASFEKLKESLQQLPQSLSQLVGRALDRLLSQYRAVGGLRLALGALALSTTGLREGDLYGLLNSVSERTPGSGLVPWPTALRLARTPTGRVPMATFTQIVRSLQSLIGQAHSRDDLLALTNPDVRQAFEELLLPDSTDRICCHQILSAHLWAAADPLGTETFLHCEADHIKQLPEHLMKGDQCEALGSLLSNYYFLYANVRHGLVHHLLAIYGSYGGSIGLSAERCADFLRRHAVLLSSWPPLFLQQALNEPPSSGAHAWARGLVGKGGPRGVVRLLNHDGENEARPDNCELVSTFSSEPTCVALNPRAELVAVGTGQGTLHLIHTQTGQVVKSLESSCDGISSCVFLTDVTLATTSFSGQIEVWDTENGCRTALIEGHSNRITGSEVSPDRKHLATVSLDFQLKVWSATKGHQVASRYGNSPINCVTFNPEGDLLAFGCWDGKVVLWNWLQNKLIRSITGHEGSVRSLSFSSSSSSSTTLVSGSLSGEVKVWAVPEGTCVGSYQAHRGSTSALTFLDQGNKLLSAGADHTLHLWSGGLGCSLATLRQGRCEQASPRKRPRSSEPPALCVAVSGGCAAVGYHGNGLRLFSLDSETSQWASEDLRVSVLCLLWLSAPPPSDADTEPAGAELLVSAGADRHLRLWRRSEEGKLVTLGDFGVQTGDILALAQNSTHLASASDDFTIALWSVPDLTLDPWVCPTAVSVLRGHSRGVTCLAFSPDGTQLLSGGKDQALLLWDTASSPPALSKSLLHAHKDWITGCAWAAGRAVSSSNDGSIYVWNLDSSSRIMSITWKNPLTSICVQGEYLVAGCTAGALHVWKWESATEVSHVPAHAQRIHHCSVLPSEDKPEDMVVATASEDGSVQLWKPFQVEHFCTFQGHSGAVRGVVSKNGLTEFFTVSADLSLRSWAWEKDSAPAPKVLMVTAICYSQTGDALLAAYESGLVEIWQQGAVVGRKQVSDRPILAMCSMPDARFAVSCKRSSVQLLKLVWSPGSLEASLVKVSTFPVKHPLAHLHYCSTLIGVSEAGTITDVMVESRQDTCSSTGHVFGMFTNDSKSMWLVGRREDELELSFLFVVGLTEYGELSCTNLRLPTKGEEGINSITAVAVEDGLIVCGDVDGNMWFKDSLVLSPWSPRRPAHRDRISLIKITSTAIISASHDQTVKLWDKITKKQVGMFVCGSPVQVLEVSPRCPGELVCGDEMGKLYFLRWNQ